MRDSERTATPAGIDAAEVELGVAETLLHSEDGAALEAARYLLGAVETALGEMASASDTDTETATHLLTARADLSGHLLAAGALETAGAPPDGVARMLQRAARIARAGLASRPLRRPTPVGAGRR